MEYVQCGELTNAVTSLLSDMDKREDTTLPHGIKYLAFGLLMQQATIADITRFIQGVH
jgi:hypothetical protein